MSEAVRTALEKHPDVQALVEVMKANSRDISDLLEVFRHVGALESQLAQASEQLSTMRQELAELREVQNHPIKKSLQKAASALENGISDARAKLNVIKDRIVAGSRKTIAAFIANGAKALNGLAGFFGVKKMLEDMHTSLNRCMNANENSIRRIAAFSAEYHEAGNHLKNMGRALVGKDTVQDVKPIGRLAKLAQVPYKVMHDAREKMMPKISKAIGRLESLEEAAARKPSVRENLQVYKKQAERAALETPPRTRTQNKEATI